MLNSEGLLNKHFYISSVKISAKRKQLKPICIFPHYKSLETLSCHGNLCTYTTAIKNNVFIKVNAMNISAEFQLYPPSAGLILEYVFANLAFRLP